MPSFYRRSKKEKMQRVHPLPVLQRVRSGAAASLVRWPVYIYLLRCVYACGGERLGVWVTVVVGCFT